MPPRKNNADFPKNWSKNLALFLCDSNEQTIILISQFIYLKNLNHFINLPKPFFLGLPAFFFGSYLYFRSHASLNDINGKKNFFYSGFANTYSFASLSIIRYRLSRTLTSFGAYVFVMTLLLSIFPYVVGS